MHTRFRFAFMVGGLLALGHARADRAQQRAATRRSGRGAGADPGAGPDASFGSGAAVELSRFGRCVGWKRSSERRLPRRKPGHRRRRRRGRRRGRRGQAQAAEPASTWHAHRGRLGRQPPSTSPSCRSTLYSRQLPGVLPFTEADHQAAHSLFAAPPGKRRRSTSRSSSTRPAAWATRSRYLQAEFMALSDSIFADTRTPRSAGRSSCTATPRTITSSAGSTSARVDEFQEKLAEQGRERRRGLPEAPEHSALQGGRPLLARGRRHRAPRLLGRGRAPPREQRRGDGRRDTRPRRTSGSLSIPSRRAAWMSSPSSACALPHSSRAADTSS